MAVHFKYYEHNMQKCVHFFSMPYLFSMPIHYGAIKQPSFHISCVEKKHLRERSSFTSKKLIKNIHVQSTLFRTFVKYALPLRNSEV